MSNGKKSLNSFKHVLERGANINIKSIESNTFKHLTQCGVNIYLEWNGE